MRMLLIALSALATLTAVMEPARAQAPTPPDASSSAAGSPGPAGHRLRDKFDAANITHDGRLTLAQAQQGGMRRIARNFEAIDTDHKGYVTWPDVRAFSQARRDARQHGQPPDAPAPQ